MSAPKLRTAVADGVCTITLDDPPANASSYDSDDAKEGLNANLEKRKPNFSGR